MKLNSLSRVTDCRKKGHDSLPSHPHPLEIASNRLLSIFLSLNFYRPSNFTGSNESKIVKSLTNFICLSPYSVRMQNTDARHPSIVIDSCIVLILLKLNEFLKIIMEPQTTFRHLLPR